MKAATLNNSFYLVDHGCYCYFEFILWKYDLNSYQCVLIANAEDGMSLIFVLKNTVAAMGHNGPSMPFDFKFPFQKKSILIKVVLSPSKKILWYLLDWQPFRSYEKCFLFHRKSSFRSQDISVFVATFWSCSKNSLIRKISLTAKFMTSQPGLQTFAILILPNISQSKDNQKILRLNKKHFSSL